MIHNSKIRNEKKKKKLHMITKLTVKQFNQCDISLIISGSDGANSPVATCYMDYKAESHCNQWKANLDEECVS